jgi:hypothetical protein
MPQNNGHISDPYFGEARGGDGPEQPDPRLLDPAAHCLQSRLTLTLQTSDTERTEHEHKPSSTQEQHAGA